MATPDHQMVPAQVRAPEFHPGDATLVVSLGTDHHPFPRLVEWVEYVLREVPGLTCLLQHGFTRPSELAINVERMPRAQLLEYYRTADVVLVQGGPGSILDTRELGVLPLAVPRIARLGEVVDDHQVAFTEHMVREGQARLVSGPQDLLAAVREGIEDPQRYRTDPRVPAPDEASLALAESFGSPRSVWGARTMGRRFGQTLRGLADQHRG